MESNNFEDKYVKNLFREFQRNIPSFYRIKGRIPFHFCYWWFSFLRIDKKTARHILKFWISEGWCKRLKYHGIELIA